jgi:tetratricopeptide (TPR) repeat protein
VIWLRRFERELDNFRAVLDWSIEHAIHIGLRLASALERFWDGGAYHREGREWLAKVLANSQVYGTEITRFRAKALSKAGTLAWFQGDFTMAYNSQKESAALYRMADDKLGLAQALRWLGMAVFSQGDFTRARTIVDESVALCRQMNNNRELADVLYWHGRVARGQRDYEQARLDARECIPLAQEVGDITAVGMGNRLLGFIAMDQGEYAMAQSFHEKSVKIYQSISFQQGIPRALASLGEAFYAQGLYERATICYQESLERFQRSGSEFIAAWTRRSLGFVLLRQQRWHEAHAHFVEALRIYQKYLKNEGIAACLVGFAGLAEGQAQSESAAQLLGSISAFLEVLPDANRFHNPVLQRDYERITAAVHNALGEEAFEAAHATGRDMPLEQAVAYALKVC